MTAPAPPASEHEVRCFQIAGRVPKRAVPLSYRAALAAVACAMVLLPILYIGVIALIGLGMYWYAITATVIFQDGGGGLLKVVIYLAPLFAGTVLIAFMVKPLFAPRPNKSEAVKLDLDAHPQLRALIQQVCAAVGAPIPIVVELDCNVNAGARLRRGLWSLGRQDLALRIGLPLIQGLSTRELAGVLAHEFGHFSQRAGMAFTYIIRSVNDWFARVVFQRDDWDESIRRQSERGNGYVMVLFLCARVALWTTRHILRLFMMAGHAVSCLQLRQMEYDADYHEVSLAGTKAFVSTAREINRLNLAAQMAYRDLQGLWQRRQAVDDVSGLILNRRGTLAPELLQKVDANLAESKTAWFHTHPSDRDRIAHAESLDRPGIFTGDGPATELVNDLDAICRQATSSFYTARGLTVNANAIVPTATLGESTEQAHAANLAWHRLGANIVNPTRPIRWSASDFARPLTDASAVAAELAESRKELDRLRAQAGKDEEVFQNTCEHLAVLENARALLEQGVKINPRQFHLAKSDLTEAQAEIAATQQRLDAKKAALAPFEAALHRWVALVGSAARAEAFSARLPEDVRQELVALTNGLVAHEACFGDFGSWVLLHHRLACFAANRSVEEKHPNFARAVRESHQFIRNLEARTIALLEKVPNPFPTPELPTSGDALKKSLEGTVGEGRLLVLLRHVAHLYFQSLTRIAFRGEALEAALATQTAT